MIQPTNETHDFVHPELGREVTAIGGHYVFDKEIKLPYSGKEILYFVGYAVLESICCGIGGCAYVLVPGFIREWKYKKNQDDCFVSKVAPIRNLSVQVDIRRLIQKKEMVYQVTFD